MTPGITSQGIKRNIIPLRYDNPLASRLVDCSTSGSKHNPSHVNITGVTCLIELSY